MRIFRINPSMSTITLIVSQLLFHPKTLLIYNTTIDNSSLKYIRSRVYFIVLYYCRNRSPPRRLKEPGLLRAIEQVDPFAGLDRSVKSFAAAASIGRAHDTRSQYSVFDACRGTKRRADNL